ncbi:MAG TPA: hypothetical protein VFH06_03410 [Candidatus Saccharimonadales bacterium]|nr:hypothetical protein [Candidatus Saccharimonadales bacterium]
MKISTKTVASLLLVTAVAAAVPGTSEKIPKQQRFRRESQFDRLLQRHDRKGELRAEILGMETRAFRAQLKRMSLEAIARQRGFKTVREFRIALFGRLKDELHHRGWSFRRIEQYMMRRSSRVG